MTNVDLLTDAHLTNARTAPNGRSAEVVLHDGPLRQTILALRAASSSGAQLPPAASIQVLRGRVRVTALGEGDVELGEGELRVLTHERHAVSAVEDAAFLLTTVTSIPAT